MGGFCLPAVSFILFTIGMSSAHSCNPQILCPSDWETWNGSCYKLTEEKLTWADAGLRCRDMGGEMATPSSKEENDYMSKTSDILWINCNDTHTEGQWECQNYGRYSDWYQPYNEPGGGTRENCAAMFTPEDLRNGWRDVRCSSQYLTLCKGKKIMANQVSLKSWRLLASCLTGHTLREYPISSVRSCATMCEYDPGCRSFNVLHHGVGEKMCQLNNSTRFDADHTQFMKMDNLCIYGER